jgi:hypothetical protein
VGSSPELLVFKVCGLKNQQFASLAPSGFHQDFTKDVPAKVLYFSGVEVSKKSMQIQ